MQGVTSEHLTQTKCKKKNAPANTFWLFMQVTFHATILATPRLVKRSHGSCILFCNAISGKVAWKIALSNKAFSEGLFSITYTLPAWPALPSKICSAELTDLKNEVRSAWEDVMDVMISISFFCSWLYKPPSLYPVDIGMKTWIYSS